MKKNTTHPEGRVAPLNEVAPLSSDQVASSRPARALTALPNVSGKPEALINGCRLGDSASLEALLTEHLPLMQRTLRRLMGPGADSEDVLQQALITAMQGFPRFRGDSKVSTWLVGICVQVARNQSRRAYRKRRVALEVLPPLENFADERATPDQVAEDRRLLDRVHFHLSALGDKQREAFVLHVLEGYSMKELAEVTGTNVMTAKSRVFLARKALVSRAKRDPQLRGALSGVLRAETEKSS